MNDNVFLKIAEDRFKKFQSANCLMVCDFMSLEQQSMLSGFLRAHRHDGVYLYGGYPEAERKMLLFLPDYMVEEIKLHSATVGIDTAGAMVGTDESDNAHPAKFVSPSEADNKKPLTDEELCRWFSANPDECPLQILNCIIPAHEKAELSHRDYLGALMGEGIKREKIGDILVRSASIKPGAALSKETQSVFQPNGAALLKGTQSPAQLNGAQIIVMNEMADYLLENYSHVGHATLNTGLEPINALSLGEIRTQDERVNVASPRLDNIVAEVFRMSRRLAQEAISHGIVFVDGIQMSKPDFTMKGGEKLVFRGKGKIIYRGIAGQSRKGNSYIQITRYL